MSFSYASTNGDAINIAEIDFMYFRGKAIGGRIPNLCIYILYI